MTQEKKLNTNKINEMPNIIEINLFKLEDIFLNILIERSALIQYIQSSSIYKIRQKYIKYMYLSPISIYYYYHTNVNHD